MKSRNTIPFTDKADLAAEIRAALNEPNWLEVFCTHDDGHVTFFVMDDEAVRLPEYRGTGVGAFAKGKDDVLAKLKELLHSAADDIAEWYIDPPDEGVSFTHISMLSDGDGFAYDNELNKIPTDRVMADVKRAKTDKPFGFYVFRFGTENVKLGMEYASVLWDSLVKELGLNDDKEEQPNSDSQD